MYRKTNTFIFDLDGTLAYTLVDLRNSVSEAMEHYGWGSVTTEQALVNINNGGRVFVQRSMPAEKQNDDALVDEAYAYYKGIYQRRYLENTVLYDGVAEGIGYLKSKGAKLAVCTNKEDYMAKGIIDHLFGDGIFEIVLGKTDDFPDKPSPEIALFIAKQLGAAPSDITVIGDSDVDMKIGDNAGMQKVGVSWGYRPKELLLSLGAEMIISGAEDFKKLI